MNRNSDLNIPEKYVNTDSMKTRLALLAEAQARKEGFPPQLARNLFMLNLDPTEKQALLEAVTCSDNLELEEFLLEQVHHSDQNLASAALRRWGLITEHVLWQDVIAFIKQPLLSQRLCYTALELCPRVNGAALIDAVLAKDGIEEMSQVFQALLLERALQWNIKTPLLDRIAERCIEDALENTWPGNKGMIIAFAWKATHDPAKIAMCLSQRTLAEGWTGILRLIQENLANWSLRRSELVARVNASGVNLAQIEAMWPPLWLKPRLELPEVSCALSLAIRRMGNEQSTFESLWKMFSGVKVEVLRQAIATVNNDPRAVRLLRGLVSATENSPPQGATRTPGFHQDVQTTFFDLAYRGIATDANYSALSDSASPSPWQEACKAWLKPEDAEITFISEQARTLPLLFNECHIRLLSRFAKSEIATLKLIEFTYSKRDNELLELIRSLCAIGTSRAVRELILLLTRNSTSFALRNEICQCLHRVGDLEPFIPELRSALDELRKITTPDQFRHLEEELASLIGTSSHTLPIDTGAKDLDQPLALRIQSFLHLSLEAKRALRSAEFFYNETRAGGSKLNLELSPIVEMQYKAVELTLRETFTTACQDLLNTGVLQRRLDLIGYARPVARRMSEFEDYIAALEIVREIPFFSKFKLRKMLLAICQYRPGKRFTLDGIKAFGLFFLCFSRQTCRYDLARLLPLPFERDDQLFRFCARIHELQDLRNRATHEGFVASIDFEEVWAKTDEILQDIIFCKSAHQK